MKKLLAIAALLLASSAAQAQYTFDYGGKTIRIDPDRGTVQIPGVYDNTGRKGKRSRDDDDYRDDRSRDDSRNRDDARHRDRDDARNRDDARDDNRDRPRRRPPQDARTRPANEPDQVAPAAPVPTEQAAVPPAPAPVVPAAPAPAVSGPVDSSTTTAAVAPSETTTPPAPPPPAPQVQQEPPPAPRPSVAAVAPPPSPSDPDSPLGIWQTEKKDGKDGKVRIEQCGANLCGYSIDRSNRNGEQVLINMRPGDNKWTGRIVDPSSGSKYDSTIALKGTDKLRVQGCAFGGMFCGGQTWTRVN
jgi:Uncharacterized protein conserved in bacteria (DUF2147)